MLDLSSPQPEEARDLSLRHHLARRWPLYLAFAVLLALTDPVARGVVACSAAKAPGGCPEELRP